MAFSKKQMEYFQKADKRWNVKTGATRSGKTYMDYFVIPKRIRKTTGNGLIVILGNTQATVERNILDPLRKMWGDYFVGTVRNDNKINLFGKTSYVLGADKKNSVTKIQGAGIEYAYGDEITTWAEPVFQMLKSRLDKPNSVFDGTCNPDSPNHWFKKFLESDADIYQQHYTIDDNPFLSPAFVESLKKEYQGVYYQRYILGKWSRAEGLIYDMFNPADVIKCDEPLENSFIAVDYGTQNATVYLLFGQVGKQWIIKDEYFYSGSDTKRQKTDRQYADDMQQFMKKHKIKAPIIVDPSAASFIAELRQRDLDVYRADNDVANGIRYTQKMIANEDLKIDLRCKNLIDELQTYSWDSKKALLGLDVPIKENDHACDAMRYGCYTVIRRFEDSTRVQLFRESL